MWQLWKGRVSWLVKVVKMGEEADIWNGKMLSWSRLVIILCSGRSVRSIGMKIEVLHSSRFCRFDKFGELLKSDLSWIVGLNCQSAAIALMDLVRDD